MSMITEQVEYLIKLSNKHPYDSNILTLQRACKEAAKTIAQLAAKVRAANMERSTAYYNGGWIPVSERLPEDLVPVNITWVNHEPEPYYHDIKDRNFEATGIHYRGQWYWYSTTCADYLGEYGSNDTDRVDDAIEIVAWMPLPEPYNAESEDKTG